MASSAFDRQAREISSSGPADISIRLDTQRRCARISLRGPIARSAGFRGIDKVVAFDQSEPAADFGASEAGISVLNGMAAFPGRRRKNA
jgi:hypothetical protein